ncbi:MAG: MFS transporter [Anaerolineaceae bacterium]|nr:MFS transporter [Anaerolineaceae bacterium]
MTDMQRASLWRHRRFLRYWSALTISRFGSEMTFLALPLTAVILLEATPVEMGLLAALGTLPYLLIGLPAGVWVDRWPRQWILVTADGIRALALAAVPMAALLNLLTIQQLYGVAFVVGVLTTFSDITEEAFLPALIGRQKLVEGYSRLAASGSVVEIVGPGLAGLLLQILSAPFVLAIDAVTFVVSALLLGSIRTEQRTQSASGAGGDLKTFVGEMAEGLRYLFRHMLLRPMVLTAGTLQFFGGMFDALLILYLSEQVGLTPTAIGALYMAGSISGLMAAATSERIVARIGTGPVHVLGAFLIGLGMLGTGLAGGDPLPVFVLIASVRFIQGIGNTWFNITYSSIVQTTTPDALLGRINASDRFIGMGALPVGAFLGGVLATQVGTRPTLILAGVGGFVAFLWLIRSPLLKLRSVVAPESD